MQNAFAAFICLDFLLAGVVRAGRCPEGRRCSNAANPEGWADKNECMYAHMLRYTHMCEHICV